MSILVWLLGTSLCAGTYAMCLAGQGTAVADHGTVQCRGGLKELHIADHLTKGVSYFLELLFLDCDWLGRTTKS